MANQKATNITRHAGAISRQDRSQLLGQRGCLVWLTGLSGSGKSTIAFELERLLIERGRAAYVLDGDNIRHGLNCNLGFSDTDRAENIRRITEVGALFVDAGLITITAFISPFRADRDQARERLSDGEFVEVWINTPLDICEQRDPKGLYKKARAGEISDFTGIDSPYEEPAAPELTIPNDSGTPKEAAEQVLDLLESKGFLQAGSA
ncbi:MAG: adenylyl-sulfate kinase [Phycisphaerae bacterium]|nr:MAG: adenylyl-sulfate kinase [Phycisphaerae bacterium]